MGGFFTVWAVVCRVPVLVLFAGLTARPLAVVPAPRPRDDTACVFFPPPLLRFAMTGFASTRAGSGHAPRSSPPA